MTKGNPRGERRRGVLGMVRSNWFALCLLAFFASNLVFYVTLEPSGGGASTATGAETLHGSRTPASLVLQVSEPDYSEERWATLGEVVRREPELFETYDAFYGSQSEIWRIKRYGRVCIVANAFMGLSLSSGPGTALTTLAESLSRSGFEVTLLYTREGAKTDVGTIDHWVKYYAKLGLNLVPLPRGVNYDVDKDVETAHRVFMWLRAQEIFDVIHFADSKGLGFFATSAKKQGLDFLQTMLVVHLHAPHMWYKISSLKLLDQVNDLVSDHLERETAAHADYLVSPSHYMVNWLQDHSWQISEDRVIVQKHVAPKWLKKHQSLGLELGSEESVRITELVYFARAELKKGIVLFCDALDRLSKRNLPEFTVTFLGKFPNEHEEFLTLPGNINARIEDYIKHRSVKWNFEWRIEPDQAGPQNRLEYLKGEANRTSDGAEGRRLAVMPSIMENSPLSVLECLIAGVPLLATRVGGVEELVPPHLKEQILVEPAAKEIAKRLEAVLLGGVYASYVDYNALAGENSRVWAIWHHTLKHQARAFDLSAMHYGTPLVSVCVVTYNNPALLKQTLESIEHQDYANLEVIVVDDGSTLEEANVLLEDLRAKFAPKGWQVMQQANRGPGAARNQASKLASGEFLFFMDDDNYAKREEITTFVNVAAFTGADVLTCVNDYFFGNDPPPYGLTPTGR